MMSLIFSFSLVETLYTTHIYRSSHQRCSERKGVLRNFAKFTEKHLCQSFFFNKVVGLRPVYTLFV